MKTLSPENEQKLRELRDLALKAGGSDRTALEMRMLDLTKGIEQHPAWFDFGCECDLCRSYGETE